MPELSAGEIANAVGGELAGVPADHLFRDYHFDSRQVADRGLFFALESERDDGHRYLAQVAEQAGAGAVVRRTFDGLVPEMPVVRVDDPTAAYRELARHVRARWSDVRYIGVTGSLGKTTTREFISQILSSALRTHKSPGNWNNWQGMPFSLLKMPGDTGAAVFELAMSSPGLGEIDLLVEVLRPDITVMLNVHPVHLEYLHTVENVARGKMEINNYLADNGVALVNGDFDLFWEGTRALGDRRLCFGRQPRNDAVLAEVVPTVDGRRLGVDLAGRREEYAAPRLTDAQIENLFAAVLVARQVGMSCAEVQNALVDLKPVQGRGVVTDHGGVTVVDDTYNANPVAVMTSLRWVARNFPGCKVAVLGDMLELGDEEATYHAEVGRVFAGLDFDLLVTVGQRARHVAEGAREAGFPEAAIECFDEPAEAGRFLAGRVKPGSTVLFKASRGMRLERAIEAFVANR